MNRRDFVAAVVAGVVAAPMLGSAAKNSFPTRKLGRTGLQVPIMGFGSGSRFLMYQDEEKALEAVNRALDLGITYIDTAHSYGDGRSEERIGRVLATRRNEVTLSTKIAGRTADEARRQIELSLKRLKTDHFEVLHVHALRDQKDLAAIEARGGAMEAFIEARNQKITRAIGITCHADPVALKTALEQNDFDCTQMALNAGLARMVDVPGGMKAKQGGAECFETLALPVAVKKKMGIIGMKVLGQEQLLGAAPLEDLIRYTLSLPVSLVSIGMPKLEHIEYNAALARRFQPMSARQRRRLAESIEASHKLAMHRFFLSHEDVA